MDITPHLLHPSWLQKNSASTGRMYISVYHVKLHQR